MIQINMNLVFTIINLLVLYLLMKKFLFGPVIHVMDQRQQMLDQQLEEAKKTEDRANELQKKYENALKSAKEDPAGSLRKQSWRQKLRPSRLHRRQGLRLTGCWQRPGKISLPSGRWQ